ncbi:MAG: site-2 protease family protein, partial [bacterium]|nr:site-2 protease family protein [bacterium]
MSFVLFIAVLVILIVVHELGHFLVAKLFKVRVDEFGIGYPPRAFNLGRIGETLYTLNWLPFGGFVKIFGEQKDTKMSRDDRSRALVYKPKSVQAAVLIAGVLFNILFAWFLFTSAPMLGSPTAIDEATAEGRNTQLVIS